jgi:hypothetical protein
MLRALTGIVQIEESKVFGAEDSHHDFIIVSLKYSDIKEIAVG